MRILYLAPNTSFAGGENVTLQIAMEMKKRGHTVIYCSPCGEIEKAVQEREIPFLGLKRFSLGEIKKAMKEFRPDIVHAMDYRASFYASLLFKNTIGHLHADCLWLKKFCPNSLALFFTSLKAKSLICVSSEIPKHYIFKKWTANKMKVLLNCIDGDILRRKSTAYHVEKKYDIGFCGRLTEEKDPISFIKIVAKVQANQPNVSAVMIGDGKLREDVQNAIKEYKLDDNVDMVGFQKNPFPYINACKLILMPSLWEGFPLVAIEAMSLGKPLVSTPVSGLVGLITDECGGMGETIEELTEKVERCLGCSEEVYNKISENAEKVILKFTDIEEYANQIESCYLGLKPNL